MNAQGFLVRGNVKNQEVIPLGVLRDRGETASVHKGITLLICGWEVGLRLIYDGWK
jgi:hypothetical protein